MKKLTLTGKLQRRLQRLSTEVSELYYRGLDPHDLADQVCIAVVGTRKPTPYGRDLTEKIVADLAGEGVVIISGLAFGVDITAHKATLQANGQTIAVLPSDIDHIYPASHRAIAASITEQGTVISEYPDNPQPQPHQFLERNRIIAALSDAVFIPEAAARSGSLNTAMHARGMNIPVFAAPGRTIDPMSSGTNHLIKSRLATMTEKAADILRSMDARPTTKKSVKKEVDTLEAAVLTAIESGVQDTTLLQKELGIETNELLTALTLLEINGHVSQNDLGQWHAAT